MKDVVVEVVAESRTCRDSLLGTMKWVQLKSVGA